MATQLNTTNPSRFHNLPLHMLADEIGDLDCRIKALEAQKDAARLALLARGAKNAVGSMFTVSFTNAIRQTLDANAVKAAMGQQWFDDHSRLAEVTSMRVAVNKAALAAA